MRTLRHAGQHPNGSQESQHAQSVAEQSCGRQARGSPGRGRNYQEIKVDKVLAKDRGTIGPAARAS
jgi:hypothetical protein